MRRFLVPGLITLVAVGLLAILAYGVSNQTTSSSIDAEVAHGHFPPAPNYDLALPVLDSRTRESLRDLRGKVVLINVFASWCAPCAEEAPTVERAEQMLARHDGTVLGITYEDYASDDVAFAREYHLTYPILRDVNGDFVQAYGTTGVPESFVVNRQGRIQALDRDPITDQWVDQTLPKILNEA
jgi:cytochrome c biogenesis protein CcmG/thiol:disulfide interchange protein DsbE